MNLVLQLIIAIVLMLPLSADCQEDKICVERKILERVANQLDSFEVSKKLQDEWLGLITNYLEIRETLRCVVVVIDLRHPLKTLDRELVDWLRIKGIPFLPVYTKRDKLSRNQQQKQAALLDAALGLASTERVLFSAKSGEGKEELITALAGFLC